jgi:hypothetical protein
MSPGTGIDYKTLQRINPEADRKAVRDYTGKLINRKNLGNSEINNYLDY